MGKKTRIYQKLESRVMKRGVYVSMASTLTRMWRICQLVKRLKEAQKSCPIRYVFFVDDRLTYNDLNQQSKLSRQVFRDGKEKATESLCTCPVASVYITFYAFTENWRIVAWQIRLTKVRN